MTKPSELILRRLAQEDEQAFQEAFQAWDWSSGFVFARGYSPGMSFADYLDLLRANE